MTQLTSRIAIDPKTHRKAQVLASAGVRYAGNDQINDLVRFLLEDAWQEAKGAGIVNDKMLKTTETAKPKGDKK